MRNNGRLAKLEQQHTGPAVVRCVDGRELTEEQIADEVAEYEAAGATCVIVLRHTDESQ